MQKEWYERIRELRVDRDLTQSKIASILNTRQEYYSKYEQGKIELPLRHLKTLCNFYNIPADYILFGQTDPVSALPAVQPPKQYESLFQQLNAENKACIIKIMQAFITQQKTG